MSEKLVDEISGLIKEGEHVKKVNYVASNTVPHYLSGQEYEIWMNKIKIFTKKYCNGHSLYDDMINAVESRNSWGMSAYNTLMGCLQTLLIDKDFINAKKVNNTQDEKDGKSKMIFISHSREDIEYVKAFVNLLNDIGIRSKAQLFCSSMSGYWIPNRENIYDYLKQQFKKDLHVICMLSENYYESPACLNEMGASWVTSKKQTAILLPDFTYSQIRGAIDALKIWFKMNDKERINEFKDELVNEFQLETIEQNIWEAKRDKYLQDVNTLKEANIYKNRKQNIEVEEILPGENGLITCILRFINKGSEPQKCKYIDIGLTDKNDKKIKFRIGYDTLKNFVIFGYENKRIELSIPVAGINDIDKFDLLSWIKWDSYSQWTHYIK